jgi:hypothetical protein
MLHPDQLYDISRLRYEEFVAQSERDNLAASCCANQHRTPLRGVQRLAAWLGAVGTSLLRTLQRPFGRPTELSAHKH